MEELSVYLADQTIAYMVNESFLIGVGYGNEHPLMIWVSRSRLPATESSIKSNH